MVQRINERLIAPSLRFKNTTEKDRKDCKELEFKEALWACHSHVITGTYRWDSCAGIDWKDESQCHVKMVGEQSVDPM